jgi:Ca2+-binding EF-hand superfamily protein
MRSFVVALVCSPAAAWWANPLKAWGNPLGRTDIRFRPAVTPPDLAPVDNMEWAFKYFDADNSGFLDKTELKEAFAAVGQPVDDATLTHSFSLIDTNHDGKISLDEFRVMATQNLVPSLAKTFMSDNDHAFEANEDMVFTGYANLRDQKLASDDPKKYCADRCLATGFCEVLEDFYDMTTTQVQTFCEACAGSDECELSYA